MIIIYWSFCWPRVYYFKLVALEKNNSGWFLQQIKVHRAHRALTGVCIIKATHVWREGLNFSYMELTFYNFCTAAYGRVAFYCARCRCVAFFRLAYIHTIDQAGNRAFPLVTLHLHKLDRHITQQQCFPSIKYFTAATNACSNKLAHWVGTI